MDVAICCYDTISGILEFAGADRPLVYFSGSECIIIKGNINGIGGYQSESEIGFTKHVIQTQKGDSFYIFSDGYNDQFGGPRGKKLMSQKLVELLKEIKKDTSHLQEIKLNS